MDAKWIIYYVYIRVCVCVYFGEAWASPKSLHGTVIIYTYMHI